MFLKDETEASEGTQSTQEMYEKPPGFGVSWEVLLFYLKDWIFLNVLPRTTFLHFKIL